MKKHWKGLLMIIAFLTGALTYLRSSMSPFPLTEDTPEGSTDSRRNIRARRKVARTQYS